VCKNFFVRNFLIKLESLLDKAGKDCQGQTLWFIIKIRKLRTKKFYNIGPLSATIHFTL
jgi:hypothetical protein